MEIQDLKVENKRLNSLVENIGANWNFQFQNRETVLNQPKSIEIQTKSRLFGEESNYSGDQYGGG